MRGHPVKYTVRQILNWADRHYEWYGEWPTSRSEEIHGENVTWAGIDTALRRGIGGLPGGDSLARLLARHRKVTHTRRILPDVTTKQILEWADSHHRRTGRWPSRDAGAVAECPDISWSTIDRYLRKGGPNLKGGSSLIKLLRENRGTHDRRGNRLLTVSLVLKWAKEHKAHTGRWPVTMSGPLINRPHENWAAIDVALRNGRRGFPMKTSLSRLLRSEFGDEAYERGIGPKTAPPPRPRVRMISVGKRKKSKSRRK